MSAIVKTVESSQPRPSGVINFNLGAAHKEMGREGGIEQATLYYQKAVELAKKAGDNEMLSNGGLCLAQCYVKMGRVDEAMDLHKSLCDDIGKESLDPSAILVFAEILEDHHENSHALEILEHHLDTIERSWGKREQCKAYDNIASLYNGKNDCAKSNIYCERHLSIAKEANSAESEDSALHRLGHNYGRMGEYGNAMEYLEQALVIEFERGDDRIVTTYCAMGDSTGRS